jgi:imidazolonepropionase-like amidohydrolase
MKKLRHFVLVVGPLLGASGAGAETPAVFAVVGGRILPVSGPALEKGTVLLRDGLIEAVGENVTVPIDARCAELLREKKVPVLLKVLRLPARSADPYDAAYANAAALHRAGVPFAIVTDDPDNGRNLPYEAAMARAYGLPAEAALRAMTLSPAEILGVADRMGSITPGKAANVIVTTGDVMDHRTQVEQVFIDGVAQSLETRHTRLYREFKERP